MAYTINKTDGTILSNLADGQTDNFSTDLTLIGKNYTGFGEALNENFVKLLENFSNVSEPPNPIRGQIWFDVSELKLKVYNGSGFVPVSSATISTTQPLTLGVGDLWFDDLNKQLFFYDGTNTILLGPDYSVSQGLSGIKVTSVLDTLNQNRVISLLYTNGILLGIFSKDSFTPKLPIDGFSGSIEPGFNQGTLSGIKFNVTATNSDSLGGQPASSYVRNDTSNIINGQLILASNLGLIVGDASQAQLLVSGGNVILANIASDKAFNILVRRGVVAETAININSADRKINLYDGISDSEIVTGGDLTVSGNVTIKGSLLINDGDITVVKTSELQVEDKIINLAQTGDSSSNNDENANGGGIILQGNDPHEFLWNISTSAWESTENINLIDRRYYIDGIEVLSKTSLGPTVTSIPGVTSFGTQTILNVGPVISPATTPTVYTRIEDNRISTIPTNLDLELAPNGSGDVVLIGSPRITGLSTTGEAGVNQAVESPSGLSSEELSESTNKEYVLNMVRRRSLAFTMDISDGVTDLDIAGYLAIIAPPNEYESSTIARVLCQFVSLSNTEVDFTGKVQTVTRQFNTPTGTAFGVIEPVTVDTVTVGAPATSITRIVKVFAITAGIWTHQGDIGPL
jgi:hypothetical protein